MKWTKALSLADAAKKSTHIVRLGSQKICLWFHNDQWFAFDLRCPHEGYPLSQGDVDRDCILACRWHNWQFRLTDGKTLRGEDRLQTYPIKIEADHLWIDITPPPESERRKQLSDDMRKVFSKRYYGAMGRIWAKWHKQGFPATDLLAEMVDWVVPHLERGFNHSLASLVEWVNLADRLGSPTKQLSCFLEASDFLAEEVYGEPEYPYHQGSQPFRAEAFLAAIEHEDEATALGMVRDALGQGNHFVDLEAHLAKYAFSHYLGYGHGVIYLSKIQPLINQLGQASLPKILAAYIRYAIVAIRDDALPEFKHYPTILSRVSEAMESGKQSPELLEPPPLGASLNQIWEWLITAVGRHTPAVVFEALIHAASNNLLHFDTQIQTRVALKPADTFSWLSLSHALTFAEAAMGFSQRFPAITPAALVQLAAFIGRVKPAINPALNPQKWLVEDENDFRLLAQQKLLEHGETQGIYPAHWLKTFLAAEALAPLLNPPARQSLWAALNRYMHAPFHKKLPERTIHQALDLISEKIQVEV